MRRSSDKARIADGGPGVRTPELPSTADTSRPPMTASLERRKSIAPPKLANATGPKRRMTLVRGSLSRPTRRGALTADASSDADPSNRRASSKGQAGWGVMRGAVFSTMFWKRLAKSSSQSTELGLEIGSLRHFIDGAQLGPLDALLEKGLEASKSDSLPCPMPVRSPSPRQPGQPLRKVHRMGDEVSLCRTASPRTQQLREMLPGLQMAQTPIYLPRLLGARPQSREAEAGQDLRVTPEREHSMGSWKPEHSAKARKEGRPTNFKLSFTRGLSAKPRADQHPLLAAIENMQEGDLRAGCEREVERGLMAQRLDELRWAEPRRGAWACQAPPPRDTRLRVEAPPSSSDPRRQGGQAGAPGAQSGESAGVERLLRLVAPQGRDMPPDALVPLMLWLGLARRRSAALTALELAFGPGRVEIAEVLRLDRNVEVQLRLVEGLKRLTRHESLEQLCEYVIDWTRLRGWFQEMKQDTSGRVDVVEVQHLFARMELTSDRQALFRFLSFVARGGALPARAGTQKAASTAPRAGDFNGRTFGIEEFASVICRCIVTWCLHRTLVLVSPPAPGSRGGADGGPFVVPLGVQAAEHDVALRWTQLQRKIVVSLLVNSRFWGRESRHILTSLNQANLTTLGHQLSPEQWLSLFQRVRAQGMASTLPTGDEVDDPDFLRKKATHDSIVAVLK